MKRHSLSDTDEGVAIFTDSVEKEIRNLDTTRSRDALTAIINCLDSPVPASVVEKPYETCEELEQLRQGGMRLYVKLVTDVPLYDVLWVFTVKKHRYRNLGKFDVEACRKVAVLGAITDEDSVERYIDRNEALTLEELKRLRERL